MNPTFPSFDLSAELRDARRQKAGRRVTQSLIPVHAYAHRAAKHMRTLNEAVNALRLLMHINTELALVDAKRIVTYMLIWIAALATYFLDLILVAAIAEYFARRVYTTPFMVTFAQIVIPAAILIIELLISSQRALNREESQEYGSSRGHWIWIFFTLLILCVLPSMVVATHLASLPARLTPALEQIHRYQLVGLVAICVVLHGTVLHGGRLAMEAQAYLWFKLRAWPLKWKIRRLHEKFDAAATAATNGYIEHVRLIREHNAQFGDSQLKPGPFDKLTRQLLQARLGDEDEDLLPLFRDAPGGAYEGSPYPVEEIPAREQSNLI